MRQEIGKILAEEMEKTDDKSIIKWIEVNNIRNEKNEPIEFATHPFLVQIFNDFTTNQSQVKCAQVGSSTTAIIKTLYLAKNKNYNVIHTLPTADFSAEFVKSKVDPIIAVNNDIFNVIKRTDSTRHKQMGLAHLFYRGTFTEKEGISISADVLINDEYDRSNPDVIEVFESRLDSSAYKRKWIFSNPTIPGHGVDRSYKSSKQYHWFIKCSHCGHWQYMKWPDSLDEKNKIFICLKCRGHITDEDRINGIWVPKFRDRQTNGYWLSQLFCIWHNAEKILYDYEHKKRDVFYNFTLGMPYEGSDVTVKKEHISRILSNNLPKAGPVTMGIDQGSTFYITVGGVDGISRMYTVGSWEEVQKEIERNNPEICIIDGLPETNEVKKLQVKFGSTKVYPAFYKDKPDDPRTVRFERQTTDRRTSAVYIDRFRSLDDLIRKIVAQEIKIFLEEHNPNIQLVMKHFESLYRVEETNKVGQTYYVWKSSSGQDHFAHSMNYWYVALERISHVKKMEIDDDENKRPYNKFETPEERLQRLDDEYYNMEYMPNYLGKNYGNYKNIDKENIDN